MRTCKYCGGSHGSADHAHSNSMKESVNKEAKKVSDSKYAAESHNRKSAKLRALKAAQRANEGGMGHQYKAFKDALSK